MSSFLVKEHQERLQRIQQTFGPSIEGTRPEKHIAGNSEQGTYEQYMERCRNALGFDIMSNVNQTSPNISGNNTPLSQPKSSRLTTPAMSPQPYATMAEASPEQTYLYDNSRLLGNEIYDGSRWDRTAIQANDFQVQVDRENFIDPALRTMGAEQMPSWAIASQNRNYVQNPAVGTVSSDIPTNSLELPPENEVTSTYDVQSHTQVLQNINFGAALSNIHPAALFPIPAAVPSHVSSTPSTQSQHLQSQKPQNQGNRPTDVAISRPNHHQVVQISTAGPTPALTVISPIHAAPAVSHKTFAGFRKGLFAKGHGAKDSGGWSMETETNHLHPWLKFHRRPDFKVYPKGKGSDLSVYMQRANYVRALSQSDRKLLADFIQMHVDLVNADKAAEEAATAAAGPPQQSHPNTTQVGQPLAAASNKRRRDHEAEDEVLDDVHGLDAGAVSLSAPPPKRAQQSAPSASTPQNQPKARPSGSTGHMQASFPDFEAVNKCLLNFGQPGIMEIVNNHLVSKGRPAIRLIRNPGNASSAPMSSNLNSAVHGNHTQQNPLASDVFSSSKNSGASTVAAFLASSSPHTSCEQPCNTNVNGRSSSGNSELESSQSRKRKANLVVGANDRAGEPNLSASGVKKSRPNPKESGANPSSSAQKPKSPDHKLPASKSISYAAAEVMYGHGHRQYSGFEPSGIVQTPPNPVEPTVMGSEKYQTQDHIGAEIGNGGFEAPLSLAPQPSDLFGYDNGVWTFLGDNIPGYDSLNLLPPSAEAGIGQGSMPMSPPNLFNSVNNLGNLDFSGFDPDSFNI